MKTNTENTPLISIIIPCYNVGRYVEKCIRSIMEQNYVNLEIIPVNDGSQDYTPQILDNLALEDRRIKLIHKNNQGVSAARNSGLDVATGEYVVFVDGDDYLSEDYVDYMLLLAKKDGADMVLSKNWFMRHNQPQLDSDNIETISPIKATTLLMSQRIMVGCWNKMYRKKFLDENNLRFSTTLFYGEGLYFITKASQMANKVTTGERMVYYYRKNNDASATMKYKIENHHNGEIAINKIKDELICSDSKLLDMIDIHKTCFCMNALIQTYACELDKTYRKDCRHWKTIIKKHLPILLISTDVSAYRKIIVLTGLCFPRIISKLNILHRKRMAKLSVR